MKTVTKSPGAIQSKASGMTALYILAMKHNREQFPNVPDHARSIHKYEDKSANGLTRCINDYTRFIGGYSVRVNTMGTYRESLGKFTPGGTTPGTADLHLCLKGIHISVEVKIGRDRLSDKQLNCKAQVEAAGGIYLVVSCFQDFYDILTQLPGISISIKKAGL